MSEELGENKLIKNRSVILLLAFMVIAFLFLGVFLFAVGLTASSSRHTDNKFISVENKAIRGKIISSDNFVVSYSQKLFRAEINTKSIDPTKKDLFVKLFSIYSGMSEKEVLGKFVNKSGKNIYGRIVLSENIDVRLASDLRSLGYKMRNLDIFRPLNPKKPHLVFGLDIIPASEMRYFPHKKLLTPIVGYMRTEVNDDYKTPTGIKGLEKSYSSYLKPEQNGLVKGKRDVLGTPLRGAESKEQDRIDGMDLHLNINLDFQRSVEKIIDKMKKQVAAEEIMVAVMNSETGAVLALATSERFNPSRIRQKDVKSLNPNFSEYLYEPGSVMKPLTLAIAIDAGKVDLKKAIPLGGKFKVTKNYTISDDDYFKELRPKGIIMYSSNIGIAKISWMLTGRELYEGWKNFGLSKPSGIDLSKELSGRIKGASLLNHKVHAANTAYGYGMFANFMQMVKAYSAFNNDGIAVTPKIVSYISDSNGRRYEVNREVASLQACTARTAGIINDMLLGTVNRGTGSAAQYDGLSVGGKTGTAHVAYKGRYIEEYHSSFYGFANDKMGNKYTIGVFTIKPKKVYFASQTSAPVFQKVVATLVKHNYLTVDKTLARIHLAKREAMRKRKHDAYVRKIQKYNRENNITE